MLGSDLILLTWIFVSYLNLRRYFLLYNKYILKILLGVRHPHQQPRGMPHSIWHCWTTILQYRSKILSDLDWIPSEYWEALETLAMTPHHLNRIAIDLQGYTSIKFRSYHTYTPRYTSIFNHGPQRKLLQSTIASYQRISHSSDNVYVSRSQFVYAGGPSSGSSKFLCRKILAWKRHGSGKLRLYSCTVLKGVSYDHVPKV